MPYHDTFVICPVCGDQVPTRYRPVICAKCDRPIEQHLLPPVSDRDFNLASSAPSYIFLTTLSLIFCFLPAIAGVINSLLVMSDKKRGDWIAAERHSQFAKQCAIAAFILGLLVFLGKLGSSVP